MMATQITMIAVATTVPQMLQYVEMEQWSQERNVMMVIQTIMIAVVIIVLVHDEVHRARVVRQLLRHRALLLAEVHLVVAVADDEVDDHHRHRVRSDE